MASGKLLVLSYNVCLEAMANKYDGKPGTHHHHFTATELGRKCDDIPGADGLTKCAKNMADLIEQMPATVGAANFDFVGLQEAARVGKLVNATPSTLKQLKMMCTTEGHEDMASFYDPKKYDLVQFIHGDLDPIKKGRPYQILVCSERSGSGGVIFINLHYSHDRSTSAVEQAFDTISQILSQAWDDAKVPSSANGYRIVVVGDCNEAGWLGGRLVTPKWTPLGKTAAGISTPVEISGTPLTCCQPDGVWIDEHTGTNRTGHRGGDYIFASGAPAKPEIPGNYDYTKLCSDHLPVIAEV